MTADAAHQGDAIILYHEETADDMTRHRYVYKRLKVLTEKGKDRASVKFPMTQNTWELPISGRGP